VIDEDLVHPLLERPDLAVGDLELDVDHGAMADQGQGLGQGRDGLVRAGQAHLAKVGGGVVGDAPLPPGHPRSERASWNTIASPSALSWTSSSMP
jgi:hypothetical protein